MRLFWLLLIVVQIAFAAAVTLEPVNATRVPYRHDERAAAIKARREHPSPETKAALQEEMRLVAEHVSRQQFIFCGVLIVALLLLDMGCFYGWRNFGKNFGYKSPSA